MIDNSTVEIISRNLIKVIFQTLSLTIPPIGLANIAIDMTKELSSIKKDKELSLPKQIRAVCEKHIYSTEKQYIEIVSVAAEICLSNIDLFSNAYSEEELANKLCSEYIQKNHSQYGEDELEKLHKMLPPILECVIPKLERYYEGDLDFQVKWRITTNKMLQLCANQIAEHSERIDNIDSRLRIQEECSGRPTPKVAELKENYEQKWDKTLFLDNKKTLKQVYQLPNYQYIDYWYEEDEDGNDESINADYRDDLDTQLQNTLLNCNNTYQRMLVVLGHPGSGKSTLITYLLNNHINDALLKRTIRVYRFSGFCDIDWNKNTENLPQLMLNEMGLLKSDLNNSVLILDGLDEIAMHSGHEDFLNNLFLQWASSKEITHFSLIITCRRNRINDIGELQMRHILLCPLNGQQIEQFADAYWGKSTNQFTSKEKSILNRITNSSKSITSVMGIPLILYMSLALEIDLSGETGLGDIYEQIFSTSNIDNSIYYRKYDRKHPITSNEAEIIHLFSKKIAELIWEYSPEEGIVEKQQYEPISNTLSSGKSDDLREILIGQYFMEGADGCQLLFVHRSMHEYFIALSIYDGIAEIVNSELSLTALFSKKSLQSEECKLTIFTNLFGMQNIMDYPDIQGFLLHMLKKNPLGNAKWWSDFFECFLKYGLSDAASGRIKGGEKGLEEELNRFYNLIWLTREQLRNFGIPAPFVLNDNLCDSIYLKIPYDKKKDLSELYLKNISLMGYNYVEAQLNNASLQNAVLSQADFSGADLSFINLISSDMHQINLSYASLANAKLQGADLKQALLSGSILENADFSGADLANANLSDANLSHAKFVGANLENAIFEGAIIDNVTFDKANMKGVSLNGMKLKGSSFNGTNFMNASLNYVTLSPNTPMQRAIFSNSHLLQADFQYANLSYAQFENAAMQEMHLQNSKLENTNFRGADLSSANLENANLESALFKNAICENACMVNADLINADLRDATLTHADLTSAKLRKTKVGANTLNNAIYGSNDYKKWSLDHSLDFGQRVKDTANISHLSDDDLLEVDDGIFVYKAELETFQRLCEESEEYEY